ncbi:MAG: LamG domain-containing protein, partial [Planctomycetales bacterium]
NSQLMAEGYGGVAGSGGKTISAWIQISANGRRAICGWGSTGGPGNRFAWYLDGGKLELAVISGQAITGETPVNDGLWHHVVLVFPDGSNDVGDAVFYVDSQLESTTGGGQSVSTHCDMNVTIGDSIGSGSWKGRIDDLRIYDYGLTSAEVLALFNEG